METATIQVTPENFQSEVVEQSQQRPVVLLFWADQAPASVQTRTMVETLVGGYAGKVALALCDVAVDPTLAQHLQVRGLPAMRIVDQGKIVEQIDGPVEEQQFRGMLDALTASPAELIKGQLQHFIDAGDFETAVGLLQQAINEEPSNQSFRVELADILVMKGDVEDARMVLASIPEDTAERERPQNRLEFLEEAAAMPSLEELEATVAAEPDNLDAAYNRCVQLIVHGQTEQALESALDLMRKDRSYRDDIARLTMIRVFALLGKGHPLATSYRRKMFNFMH